MVYQIELALIQIEKWVGHRLNKFDQMIFRTSSL